MVCTQDTASSQAVVSSRQSLSGARAERALLMKLDRAQICAALGPSLVLSAPQNFGGGKQPTTLVTRRVELQVQLKQLFGVQLP